MAFMMFQAMFAVITVVLITGAFVERIKFSAFLIFSFLWATFVYDPIAHWVWGTGGWLRTMGALDFAGGIVVHVSAGVSAVAIALVIGARKGFGKHVMEPHNIPLTILGAILLWFGWFGFNAGSAVTSGALASNAFAVTNTGGASAALTWMILSWYHKKPSVLGTVTGGVVGLAAVTPASGFVTPLAAIATGIFATTLVNPAGANGLLYGNSGLLFTQVIAVAVTWVYSFVVTFILAKVIDTTIGLRVSEEEEAVGLDVSQHAEKAYS